MKRLKEGDVPVFVHLPSTFGHLDESRYKGRWTLLFFYHRDFAPGCDLDIGTLLNNMEHIERLGLELVGISPDPLEKHFEFAVSKGIKFELASDSEGKMAGLYGAIKTRKPLNFKRKAFLISPDFRILKAYEGKKTVLYPLEIIYDVEFIQDLIKSYDPEKIRITFNFF